MENRFKVQIYGLGNGRRVSTMCESTELPTRFLETAIHKTLGPPREVPFKIGYQRELNLNFYQGADYAEKSFFDEWQALAFDPNSFKIKYYESYIGTVLITALDRKGKSSYSIKLNEVYPKTINAVALNMASTSTIARLSVGLAYRTWENV